MYIFVYGTILSGMTNNQRVSGYNLIGEAYTIEKYYMCSLRSKSYPMVSYIPFHSIQKLTNIKGEVYEIDKECLQRLDCLEGHPIFYTRQIIDVKCNNKIMNPFCYIVLYPDIVKEISESYEKRSISVNDGDWKKYYLEN